MNKVIEFVKNLTNSSVGSVVTQIFQIGIMSTLWMFIGNVVKTMQRNVVNLTSTTLAAA